MAKFNSMQIRAEIFERIARIASEEDRPLVWVVEQGLILLEKQREQQAEMDRDYHRSPDGIAGQPRPGIDYNPDGPMCQDDYEHLTGTGIYSQK